MNSLRRIIPLLSIIIITSVASINVAAQDDAQTHLNRGFPLYQQGQYDKALVEFEEAVKLSPTWSTGYRLIGLCYMQLKNYDLAIVALKKAVEIGDQAQQEDESAKIALGFAYYNKQQYADALPLVEYAAKRKETYDNDELVGDIHYRLNNLDAALRALNKAAQLGPKNPAPYDLMTRIYLKQAAASHSPENYKQAIESGRKLKALRDDAVTASLLGQAYLATQQFKEASVELKKASDAEPTDGALLLAYGQALAGSEQWQQAQTALEKASKQLTNDPTVFNLLGYAYEAEGARDEKVRVVKFTEAFEAYTKADQLAKGADPNIKASIERVKPFVKK